MGGATSNAPGTGEPLGVPLQGDQLLRDFKTAIEIAEAIGDFESWSIKYPYIAPLVEGLKNNPGLNEANIATAGMEKILLDEDERTKLSELSESFKELNLARFLGAEAVVKAHKKGPISGYQTNEQRGRQEVITRYRHPKKTSAKIASLQPAKQLIHLAHGVTVFNSGDTLVMGRFRWDIIPFDYDTGEPLVDIILKVKA